MERCNAQRITLVQNDKLDMPDKNTHPPKFTNLTVPTLQHRRFHMLTLVLQQQRVCIDHRQVQNVLGIRCNGRKWSTLILNRNR